MLLLPLSEKKSQIRFGSVCVCVLITRKEPCSSRHVPSFRVILARCRLWHQFVVGIVWHKQIHRTTNPYQSLFFSLLITFILFINQSVNYYLALTNHPIHYFSSKINFLHKKSSFFIILVVIKQSIIIKKNLFYHFSFSQPNTFHQT